MELLLIILGGGLCAAIIVLIVGAIRGANAEEDDPSDPNNL